LIFWAPTGSSPHDTGVREGGRREGCCGWSLVYPHGHPFHLSGTECDARAERSGAML